MAAIARTFAPLTAGALSPATDLNRREVEASIRASYAGPVIFAEDKLRIAP